MTIPLVLFCDDTSGNKSKKWNKFIEWDLIIAGTILCFYWYINVKFPYRTSTEAEKPVREHPLSMLLKQSRCSGIGGSCCGEPHQAREGGCYV